MKKKSLRNLYQSAPAALTVGIDPYALEHLLVKKVPQYLSNRELIAVRKVSRWVEECEKPDASEWSEEEYDGILSVLDILLSHSPSLPSPIIAQTHTYKGLILEKQCQHGCAIESFLKALWVQAADEKNASPSFLALAEHRLGQAYGNNGNYIEAIATLEKALEGYEKANLREDNPVVIVAKEAMKKFRLKLALTTATSRTGHNRSDGKLSSNLCQKGDRYGIKKPQRMICQNEMIR